MPTNTAFDPYRPVMTRCGWTARIIAVDRDDPEIPIVALTLVRPGHGEGVDCYRADGRKYADRESDLDLINVRVGKRFKRAQGDR